MYYDCFDMSQLIICRCIYYKSKYFNCFDRNIILSNTAHYFSIYIYIYIYIYLYLSRVNRSRIHAIHVEYTDNSSKFYELSERKCSHVLPGILILNTVQV